jgi:hypothetical protein
MNIPDFIQRLKVASHELRKLRVRFCWRFNSLVGLRGALQRNSMALSISSEVVSYRLLLAMPEEA